VPKPSLLKKDAFDPAQEIGNAVIAQAGVATESVESVFFQPNSKGQLIVLRAEDGEHRSLLVDLEKSAIDTLPPTNNEGPLSASEIHSYIFDPAAKIAFEEQLYAGLICRGDLTVWLGREKHRKSNLILQFAICAAVGRNFLGFKFVAPKPLRVVLIDFESKSGSLKLRYEGIIRALGMDAEEQGRLDKNFRIVEVRRIRKSGRQFPKFSDNAGANGIFWDELVATNPADLYVIDPLRSLHAGDENDSKIEMLLSEMQRVFRRAAVIAAHHMRKASDNACTLVEDMRTWSDGARGSSAIKAHSDVIVLQERSLDEKGNEVVHLGVFLKDGPDVEPFPLMETDHESFYWEQVKVIPAKLRTSYDALAGRTRGWERAKAADEIKRQTGASRATAYRHIDAMARAGILVVIEGSGLFRTQSPE